MHQGIAVQKLDRAAGAQGPLPFRSEEARCLDGQEGAQALAAPKGSVTHGGHEPGRPGNAALSQLLRVLLQAKADAAGVAPKLIASSSDLDAIATGARDVPALSGWRAEVFGDDALRLAQGKIALSAQGGAVRVVVVD